MPNDYQLYDFQESGVAWLQSDRSNTYGYSAPSLVGLLGDEMGLGKTAQALMAIRPLLEDGKRLLFLVPGATITQWQKQYDRWILDCEPDDFGMSGLYALRSSEDKIPRGMSVVMSHTLLAKHATATKIIEANFDGIIIDEAHKFGTQGTKRIQHLKAICNLSPSKFEDCRIALSGTPVRNYANEIYNIAHFLDPLRFRTYEDFCRKYLTWDRKSLYNPNQFHADFSPYYLRRTVSEVQKSLPRIRRTKLYTEITSPHLKAAYNHQLDLLSNFNRSAERINAFSLLTFLVKLRHITGIAKAQEPAIIEPIRDYLVGDGNGNGNRVVIGLHHHFVSDRLQTSLSEFPHILIRGGMTDIEKEQAKQDFIKSAPPCVCLLSIKAAAEGIDGLQFAARKAYVFERQWNGQDELQFEKRLHRTGQAYPVDIEYTIATGTVDEFFDEMVEMKRRITTQVEDENWSSNPAFLRELAERVINSRL